MSSYQSKLVFVGSMGAGKTTAIRAISDVDPVSTEMPISGELVMPGKETTTVALDYSTVELGDGELLHVYGVPGQAYLDFMWPMVCDGAMGIIVLVNACDPQRVESTVGLLEAFSRMAPQACFVVGVTRADLEMDFSLMDFRDALLARGFTLPVLKVDARASVQVELLVRILLSVRFAGSQLAAEVAQGASHAVADA